MKKNVVKLSLSVIMLAVTFNGCAALKEANEKPGYIGYAYINGTWDERRDNHNIIYAQYKEGAVAAATTTPSSSSEAVVETKTLLVNFQTDSAAIEAGSFAKIKEFANFMIENLSLKALIAGHTDDRGSEAHNLDLSKRRANAVATQIVKDGVDASRISSEGYGESKPVATNKTAEGRRANRRIEAQLR